MLKILLTVSLIFTLGCGKSEPAKPHPDLSLLDAAFDAKYFPDTVKQRDEYLRRTVEAADKMVAARSRTVKTGNQEDRDEWAKWDAEGEKWLKLANAASESLSDLRAAKRRLLEMQNR